MKVYVERGHLVVHDGVGRNRETRRFHRATGDLKRLVVIGHTGFVTFEALRWIRDIGAVFVQIDADSNLVASSVSEWTSSERRLRRAQVLAAESEVGIALLRELLAEKAKRQARLVERFLDFAPSAGDPQGAILAQVAAIADAGTIRELRVAESIAGRQYWQAFAKIPIGFERAIRHTVPEHWHTAGPRTSRLDRKRAKRALTPAHAMLNYLYAILESEATIAAQRMGFDPTLGLMHADKRYRASLASDLMEPARPAADQVALDLLKVVELRRGDVVETREGICRLGPELARQLGATAHKLFNHVAPTAEWMAQQLLKDAEHPTPLTRTRHKKSRRGPNEQN